MGNEIFIYSRKSKWTGRGESIENQVRMCRDYIERRLADVRDFDIQVFEDEGYSGKNTKRPMFQEMMRRVRKGGCRCLICYKLDRLGRNIMDIAALVEELNRLEVSFISVKENFDTSTPLGKTMLYIAGIFAQMEREQIAERVRDNMVMLARSGRWLGGNTPLGFLSRADKKICMDDKVKTSFVLTENPEELLTVRFLFQEFLEKQSLRKVAGYFLRNGIRTKRGKEYTPTAVRDILTNPVYCAADPEAYEYFVALGCKVCFSKEEADGRKGLIAYAKTSSLHYKNKENPPSEWILAIGKHGGVIPGKEFVRVQRLLEANRHKGDAYRKAQNEQALLSGILYCSCGHAMRPKYYKAKPGEGLEERQFYYLCTYKDATHGEQCNAANVPGNDLDSQVCGVLFSTARPSKDEEKGRGKRTCLVREEDFLRQNIEEKEGRIKTLIGLLQTPGLSRELIFHVDQEIKELDSQRKELWKTLEEKENTKKAEEEKVPSDFSALFSGLTVPKKREVLKRLIRRVVWDGERAVVCFRGEDI